MTPLQRLILGELLPQFSHLSLLPVPHERSGEGETRSPLLRTPVAHVSRLEGQTQSKSHRSTIINPLLRSTNVVTPEVRIHIQVDYLQLARRRNGDVEIADVGKGQV